jgi:hypothetical protein
VPEEPETERRSGLVEAPREHEVCDGCIEDPRGMVVRHGERSSAPREYRLEDIRRLNARLIHSAVAHEHDLEWPGGTVRHDDQEPFRIAMQQLRPDDAGHGFRIDQSRPGGRCSGTSPDLRDRDQAARRRRPDPGHSFQPREVHRRKPGESAGPPEHGPRQSEDAPTGLTRAEHQREDLVIGERTDAQAPHPFAWAVVVGDVRKRLSLFFVIGHESTLRRGAACHRQKGESVDNQRGPSTGGEIPGNSRAGAQSIQGNPVRRLEPW